MIRDDGVAAPVTRRTGWRIAIHAIGALVTILLWVVLSLAQAVAGFVLSVCGPPTASEARAYRIELLVYGLLLALVPLAVGAVVRRLREFSGPWFALAAIVGVLAVVLAVRASTTQFCF